MAKIPQKTGNRGIQFEKIKLPLVLVLATVAVLGFYALDKPGVSQWLQYLVLWVGLLLAGWVFLVSKPGRSFIGFVQGAIRETKKVVWLTPHQTLQMTLYVLAFILLSTVLVWVIDKTVEWFLYDLILGWRRT